MALMIMTAANLGYATIFGVIEGCKKIKSMTKNKNKSKKIDEEETNKESNIENQDEENDVDNDERTAKISLDESQIELNSELGLPNDPRDIRKNQFKRNPRNNMKRVKAKIIPMFHN